MTFDQFAVAVHDWMRRLSPKQVRAEVARQLASEEGVEGLRRGISVEAVLVMVRMGLGPGMVPIGVRESAPVPEPVPDSQVEILEPPEPAPQCRQPRHRSVAESKTLRGRPSVRAQALVREQLKDGPQPEAMVLAAASGADISERALIAAADALGVRTRKGQWWLPG